jgi:hypothetical protein
VRRCWAIGLVLISGCMIQAHTERQTETETELELEREIEHEIEVEQQTLTTALPQILERLDAILRRCDP